MPFQTSLLPFVLILVSCLPAREQEGEREKLVRTEASALLDALRAGRWDEAVPFVSLDEVTRSRMEIPAGASEDEVRARVCAWFEGLYGRMKPGPVASVRIDPEDPDLARVVYRHGDFDGFHMRFAGGRWLYTLDGKPRDRRSRAGDVGDDQRQCERTHLARLHRTVQAGARRHVEAHRGVRAPALGRQDGDAAGPCRTQRCNHSGMVGNGADFAFRRRLATLGSFPNSMGGP